MCVAVGMAERESVVFAVLVLPCASKVHLPSGPRKSGILMNEISEIESRLAFTEAIQTPQM